MAKISKEEKLKIKEAKKEEKTYVHLIGDICPLTHLKLNQLGRIVKLECDLCLKEFEQKLDFDIDELYSKRRLINDSELSGQEIEIKDGQFVIDLDGADEIDIYDLLYQSVILNLPNKKVCGINCKGGEFLKEENLSDPRLDVFKNIKIE